MPCKYSVNSAYVTVDEKGAENNSEPQVIKKISLHFVQAHFTPSIGVALNADFDLLRNEGGPGQGRGRLLPLSLVPLWS